MNGMNIDDGALAGADLGAMTAQLEKANAAGSTELNPGSATTEQRAAQPVEKVQANPTEAASEQTQSDSTPTAGGEPAKPAEAAPAKPETEQPKPGEPVKSKYAQEQERRDRSWKALNEQKEAHKAEREAFAKQQAELQAERDQLKAEREQALLESTPKPEQFEAAAQRKQTEADALEKQADRAEDDGKYDEAKKLKAKAQRARVEAEQYQEAGEQARKNPNPTLAQIQEKRQAEEKEWTLKAAIDFPEFAKPNSDVAKRAVAYLDNLKTSDPALANHPKARYFAAEMATLQAAAEAGVKVGKLLQAREAEVGRLQARVKELEGLTTPGAGGSVQQQPAAKSFNEMTVAEQAAALQQQAQEMGTFR